MFGLNTEAKTNGEALNQQQKTSATYFIISHCYHATYFSSLEVLRCTIFSKVSRFKIRSDSRSPDLGWLPVHSGSRVCFFSAWNVLLKIMMRLALAFSKKNFKENLWGQGRQCCILLRKTRFCDVWELIMRNYQNNFSWNDLGRKFSNRCRKIHPNWNNRFGWI